MSDVEQKPIVKVRGEEFSNYPNDFYIPPDYLEVLLEQFEGPLDLLLYIIRKRNFEICNLPIAQVTSQYLAYLDAYRQSNTELAIEYLVMASTLIALKSRMLLPSRASDDLSEEEQDPRKALALRLEAYARCQALAQALDQRPRIWRDFMPASMHMEGAAAQLKIPSAYELFKVYSQVIESNRIRVPHQIQCDPYSVEEAISYLQMKIPKEGTRFNDMVFQLKRPLSWYLSCFLGVLEMSKQNTIELYQEHVFGTLYITWSKRNEYSCD